MTVKILGLEEPIECDRILYLYDRNNECIPVVVDKSTGRGYPLARIDYILPEVGT